MADSSSDPRVSIEIVHDDTKEATTRHPLAGGMYAHDSFEAMRAEATYKPWGPGNCGKKLAVFSLFVIVLWLVVEALRPSVGLGVFGE
eukprot:SAG31_NODE_56_length_29726_cov_41.443312_20_plen_88_part_00